MSEKPPSSTAAESYEAALFSADLGGAPEIDLHGQTVNLALSEAETFLHAELMAGTEVIRIIHGRGDQKIRTALFKWLEQMKKQDLVAAFRDSQNPAQQGAVTLVALHRVPRQN